MSDPNHTLLFDQVDITDAFQAGWEACKALQADHYREGYLRGLRRACIILDDHADGFSGLAVSGLVAVVVAPEVTAETIRLCAREIGAALNCIPALLEEEQRGPAWSKRTALYLNRLAAMSSEEYLRHHKVPLV